MATKAPTTKILPPTWTSYQQLLAVDAMRKLQKHYPGWHWGIDFVDDKISLGSMVIRIMDVPSDVVYFIRPNDVDRDRLNCVSKGGGHLLEALGLPRSKADESQWDKKTNVKGLYFVDPGAVKENNPGFEAIKKGYDKLRA